MDLLSTRAAAALLGISPVTLSNARQGAPSPLATIPYIKLGTSRFSRVAYRRSDIERWLKSRPFHAGVI